MQAYFPKPEDYRFSRRGCALLCGALLYATLSGQVIESLGQPAALGAPAPEAAAETEVLTPERWKQRLEENKLSVEQIASATVSALRAQADDTTKWNPQWGDFVELARKRGELSDDLWRDYLLGAVRFKIRVSTDAKRSMGLKIWMDQQFARTGTDFEEGKAVGRREDDLSGISIKSNDAFVYGEVNLSSNNGTGTGWTEDLTQQKYAALKPGPQKYHYRYRVQVFDAKRPEKALGERTFEASIPWQLVADDATLPLPALHADPALRAAVAKSIRVNYILRDKSDKSFVQISLQADHPPTGMAFDVFLRWHGQSWPLGPVGWVKEKIGSWGFDTDLPVEIGQVDVVLVSSAQAAAKLVNRDDYRLMSLDAIWDGPEIVIPAVDIRTQRIEMERIEPSKGRTAREHALALMDSTDPAAIQIKRDGNVIGARAQLERRLAEHPDDPAASYELGCVLTAAGDLRRAMDRFVAARRLEPEAPLQSNIQREQRSLCAMWLSLAEAGNAEAMVALGAAYEYGTGVGSDIQEAKRWYRNASNGGNAEAMCHLAAQYEQKAGSTVHTEKADQWYHDQALELYRKSAGLGYEEAKQWLTTHNR